MRIISAVLLLSAMALGADKQILLVAGKPSHGPGQHEHNAGVRLLAKWLNTGPEVHAVTSFGGVWPSDQEFEKADAVFVFSDGGDQHFAFKDGHAAMISKAAARGAGLMFIHYAVEPPEKSGHREMLDWLGGYFEVNYSINPIWEANFTSLPKHPITRGVQPFRLRDEWYYNMRFRDGRKEVTGILVTTPPAETVRADGLRSGNADVRAKIGQPQVMMWTTERPNGGRSVGYTGQHYHQNLGNESVRKLLLNALLWVAKVEVPRDGVSVAVSSTELTENLDPK